MYDNILWRKNTKMNQTTQNKREWITAIIYFIAGLFIGYIIGGNFQ